MGELFLRYLLVYFPASYYHQACSSTDIHHSSEDLHGGLQDTYECLAPIIDTDVAVAFLMHIVLSKGDQIYTDTVLGDLLEQEPWMPSAYLSDHQRDRASS